MSRPASEDFASASMVRVLLRGMALLGMSPPPQVQPPRQATVALDLKRSLIGAAVQQGGLACLLLLGRGVHDMAMEPTHLALTLGRGAGPLFVRWQRLERYIHSRHRIRIDALTPQSAQVVHVHRDGGPAPLPVEDLVVCGVLCALLEANGLQEVTAHAAGTELYPRPDPAGVAALASAGQTAAWTFAWKPSHARRTADGLPVSWMQVAPATWSDLARAAGDLVAARLPDGWTLGEAAGQLGLSSRTLQRELTREGLSYTGLVAEVRFRLAGWYLVTTAMPIAEVGFVCGYSDQAHLTRDFNRRVGLGPGRYRGHFASA